MLQSLHLRSVCLVLVLCSAVPLLGADSSAINHESLFRTDRLLEVEIEVAEADWDTIRHQSRSFATALQKPAPPSPFSYVKADVTINGVRVESVGLRKKGFIGSLDDQRPSLKIKFDEYVDQQPVAGLRQLTLNNNKQDRALVSQYLSYKLFHDAGLPASRCSLAKVTVNGTYLGVYSHVESVKKEMLERQFGDGGGKIYEGTLVDFHAAKVVGFEAKTDEGEQRDELQQIADLMAGDGELDTEQLGQHIDMDQFLRFWALEGLINWWDGYTNNQNNYFVYLNPKDSKFHFMPWGIDAALNNESMGFKPNATSVQSQSILSNRLYRTEGVPDRFRETMQGLLDSVWNEQQLLAELDRIEQLVKDELGPHQKDFSKQLAKTRSFIQGRRSAVEKEFAKWPVDVKPEPRQPFYFKPVGTLKGSFATKWYEKPPGYSEKDQIGEVDLKLVVDGETIEFLSLGANAERSMWPQPGQSADAVKPPTIVLTGKRASDKKRVTIAFSTENDSFRGGANAVTAQGIMTAGMFTFDPKKMHMLGGSVKLEDAGTEDGDVVRGTFEMEVVQFRGDMGR